MGGPGSGRRRSTYCVSDCRVIAISEFTGGGRRISHPAGEIAWRRDSITHARLTYTITDEHWPEGPDISILALRYWKSPTAAESRERIVLAERPSLAYCPTCDAPVRKLYAPPAAEHFLCRRCHGLHYRSQPGPKHDLQAIQTAMGSLLEGLLPHHALTAKGASPTDKRASLQALLATLEDDPLLGPQETRVYCLRLAKAGYSCRAIARLVGCSKSSVQRYLAAGMAAVDMKALIAERLEGYYEAHPSSLTELSRYARRQFAPAPEEKVLTSGEPQVDESPELQR